MEGKTYLSKYIVCRDCDKPAVKTIWKTHEDGQETIVAHFCQEHADQFLAEVFSLKVQEVL